ncbi:MAG: hypothetical protein WC791_03515 [Candidatus Paceibacterota bacterium]|jgi:hypothetical protein
MITDEIKPTIVRGTFHSYIEASAFLDILSDAGYHKHLTAPAEIEQVNGSHIVTLSIKKDAYFIIRASLDGDGPLEQWGENFSFAESLSS